MPEYVVERVTRALNETGKALKGSKVVVLGVAYKRDISDLRESPALDVITLFKNQGAKVVYSDPYVPAVHFDSGDMKSVKLTAAVLKSADIVVVLTDHTNFNYQWIVDNAPLVFDTRNACKRIRNGKKKIIRL